MLISDYVSSNMILCLFFHLTHFRELGQKYRNIFVLFLVQMKTLNFAFEINWPLKSTKPNMEKNTFMLWKKTLQQIFNKLLHILFMRVNVSFTWVSREGEKLDHHLSGNIGHDQNRTKVIIRKLHHSFFFPSYSCRFLHPNQLFISIIIPFQCNLDPIRTSKSQLLLKCPCCFGVFKSPPPPQKKKKRNF